MELMKKPIQHQFSVANGGGESRSKRIVANGGIEQRKSTEPIDHWAFLDQIDAPMWVDLALESMSTDQEINAGWFEHAHPFHQLSSHHFLCEGIDAELVGASSPLLPTSVSKSRGKHYRSRKWRGDNSKSVSASENHPINSLGAHDSSLFQEAKPILKNSSRNPNRTCKLKGKLYAGGNAVGATRNTRSRNPKITPDLKAIFDGEGTSGENRNTRISQLKPCFEDSSNVSSITASSSRKNNSTSSNGRQTCKHKVSFVDSRTSQTITSSAPKSKASFGDSEVSSIMSVSLVGSKNLSSFSKSGSPKNKPSFRDSKSSLESKESSGSVSNQQDSHVHDQSSGLLLAVRASLRRSYVTRQPARVEVKEKTQVRGRNSSSSKSSVGSSKNTGLKNTMGTTMRNKNSTPESGQVAEMNKPTSCNKGEVKKTSKTSIGQLQVFRSNSKQEEKLTAGRPISQETLKPKASYQSEHRKPLKVKNLRCSYTDDKRSKEFVGNINKRSVIGHNVLGRKITSKENNSGSTLWSQKTSKHTLIGNKKEVLEPKGKAPKNEVQKVYLR